MAMSLKRSEGVTAITLTSDPSSTCPPLCQLLGSLFYTPALCSRSLRVALARRGSQAVLGALWILSGVIQAALGSLLLFNRGAAPYMISDTYAPLWLGVVFAAIGVSCILTEKYPQPCTLLWNVLLNLTGVALAITAIVWYSEFDTYRFRYFFPCSVQEADYWDPPPTPTLGPQQEVLMQRCQRLQGVLRCLVFAITGLLIAVSALGLCLGLSSAILSIKSLRSPREKSAPLLEDDETATSQCEQE